MKTPWQGLAGAAIGAALVVSVYEGRVLFADKAGGETPVAAGQRVAVGADGVARVSDEPGGPAGTGGAAAVATAADVPELPPPSATATREELLQRDTVQRAEISSLRKRVHQLEQGGGPRVARDDLGDGADSDHPWYQASHDDLVRWAGQCRVRFDLPPLLSSDPVEVSPSQIKAAGLTAEEQAAVNKALQVLQQQFVSQLRALYVEATGDQAGADALGPQGMASELRDKAPQGEESRVNQAIARERAGLAQPPADLSSASPLERYLRILAGMGDRTQQVVAGVIGADRARALRNADGGWSWRMQMGGCPDAAPH